MKGQVHSSRQYRLTAVVRIRAEGCGGNMVSVGHISKRMRRFRDQN